MQFRDYLYHDAESELLLQDESEMPKGHYAWPSTYLFLIELDLDDLAAVASAQGAVRDLLERRGIRADPDQSARDLVVSMLSAQPKWLDVPTDYFSMQLMPHIDGRSGAELHSWIRGELEARFRYASQPPRWIQSPAWPIRDGRPLVFLGEVRLNDYLHDEAAWYLFDDPDGGGIEVVTQVA